VLQDAPAARTPQLKLDAACCATCVHVPNRHNFILWFMSDYARMLQPWCHLFPHQTIPY
jgi:hypothetical protein